MLILIEGMDGCGKETQAKLLAEALGVEKVSFPRYGTPACAGVEAYLNGDLALTPYGAAAAFALDRVAWANEWRTAGCPSVVLDRYIFSNFAYQGAKFGDADEARAFIEWEKDFEHNKLGLPKPDETIYLAWQKDNWKSLLRKRGGSKHKGKDIHESNMEYLDHVYDFGLQIAEDEGAKIIFCDGCFPEEVHERIVDALGGLGRLLGEK